MMLCYYVASCFLVDAGLDTAQFAHVAAPAGPWSVDGAWRVARASCEEGACFLTDVCLLTCFLTDVLA